MFFNSYYAWIALKFCDGVINIIIIYIIIILAKRSDTEGWNNTHKNELIEGLIELIESLGNEGNNIQLNCSLGEIIELVYDIVSIEVKSNSSI